MPTRRATSIAAVSAAAAMAGACDPVPAVTTGPCDAGACDWMSIEVRGGSVPDEHTVLLVVDDSPSMAPWRDAVEDHVGRLLAVLATGDVQADQPDDPGHGIRDFPPPDLLRLGLVGASRGVPCGTGARLAPAPGSPFDAVDGAPWMALEGGPDGDLCGGDPARCLAFAAAAAGWAAGLAAPCEVEQPVGALVDVLDAELPRGFSGLVRPYGTLLAVFVTAGDDRSLVERRATAEGPDLADDPIGEGLLGADALVRALRAHGARARVELAALAGADTVRPDEVDRRVLPGRAAALESLAARPGPPAACRRGALHADPSARLARLLADAAASDAVLVRPVLRSICGDRGMALDIAGGTRLAPSSWPSECLRRAVPVDDEGLAPCTLTERWRSDAPGAPSCDRAPGRTLVDDAGGWSRCAVAQRAGPPGDPDTGGWWIERGPRSEVECAGVGVGIVRVAPPARLPVPRRWTLRCAWPRDAR